MELTLGLDVSLIVEDALRKFSGFRWIPSDFQRYA